MKLGSLFDGSGGFPLAGVLNGIEPVWASEIEPFPIRVTKNRFPNMKHLGSVTDINGAEIEPVDIITFGSPCQDLSVAGKQLGIHDGQRSNLFFEAIRIIKEMREHDRATGRSDIDVRPRFAVWENVPGAFSSNKGQDFQAVIEAICRVKDPDASVPMPKGNRWLPAGCVVGDGYSLAWRVYDAQFWGVPQRRKRIYLIADFGSERAGEILFECESMCGDSAESGEAREGTAADAEGSAGRSDSVGFTNRWCESGNVTETLRAESHNALPCVAIGCDLYNGKMTGDKAVTLCANSGAGANHAGPSVFYALEGNTVDRASNKNGKGYCEDVSPTLNTQDKHAVCYPNKARSLCARHDSSPCIDRGQNFICVQNTGRGWWNEGEVAETLRTPCGGDSTKANLIVHAIDCRNMQANEELSGTIQAKNQGGHSLNYINPIVYDARGNWGGMTAPTITGDHQNRVSDYTCICVQANGWQYGDKVTPTLCGDHNNRVTDYTCICVERNHDE